MKMRRKRHGIPIFLFYFIACSFMCKGQDSLMVNFLIERIAGQQVQHDNYFLPGIFPSYYSKNAKFSAGKKDNNIFFNCLIAYVLNDIKPFVNTNNRLLIDSTLGSARPLYRKFKNKRRNTYNFWRTDSSFDFPFPTVFNLYSRDVTLPDDLDDTVLSLLALDAADSTAK